MTSERIAIVGMGLRYPDAATPQDLWMNVLAGRRAFRTIPEERTNLADYWDPNPAVPDKFYSNKAAVLRDYKFDRVDRMISHSTFASTDMTHWLALDVASEALADAGFAEGEGLPKERTAVVLGNTLVGEFSRANIMRLRWPYVRRMVSAQLVHHGWDTPQIDSFVGELEHSYKSPFPAANEDMLAGGLANTIAGRICNYFDLGGGGYTVDGACSSSLLSVIDAARALSDGDVDVALAGGVDLSIDPFELIGFAKTGALAKGEMVVYDRDSNGFWPGEGCGIVVLMREEDARAEGKNVLATITGWGMSSDGKGGITRPEESGHRRALTNAYRRAGYQPSTVSYFEGHGTGTAVGDATEIAALASTRDGVPDAWPAALSSVKANIGHTKAAAGVAGLIKATLAVHHGVIPPATGHRIPHPLLDEVAHAIRVPLAAETFHAGLPARAGVSAMGFGGINTHIALEGRAVGGGVIEAVPAMITQVVQGRQDAELLVLAADNVSHLADQIREVADTLERAAMCELTDMAVHLQREVGSGPFRAAIVARNPVEAVKRLKRVFDYLSESGGETGAIVQIDEGTWCGSGDGSGRIAFAFPGQGAGQGKLGEVLRRLCDDTEVLPGIGPLPGEAEGDRSEPSVTADLQPRIVRRSLQGLAALERVGVFADTAIGHSLGEITALAWAGALTSWQAYDLAIVRGRVMLEHIPSGGAMAVIGATPEFTRTLLKGTEAQISGYNAPEMTVVAGSRACVKAVTTAASRFGIATSLLDVDHAFHTGQCREAAAAFDTQIAGVAFARPTKEVISPSLAGTIAPGQDMRVFLVDQITNPVRFTAATQHLVEHDLIIEVGPGRSISGLVASNLPRTATATIDTDANSLAPFLDAVGAAFALGHEVKLSALSEGRASRDFRPGQEMSFLANPCEAAPDLTFVPTESDAASLDAAPDACEGTNTLDLLLTVVADKIDLPMSVLGPNTNPLEDLHMSSITVGQITNEVLRSLGRGPLSGVPSFATSSLGDIATMIDEMVDADPNTLRITGAGPWVRVFASHETSSALLPAPAAGALRPWQVVGRADALTQQIANQLAMLARVTPGLLISAGGNGPELGSDAIEALVADLRGLPEPVPLVVLHRGPHGAAAAARTIFLEQVSPRVTVVHLAAHLEHLSEDIVASIAADVDRNQGFAEVTYTGDELRYHQAWAALNPSGEHAPYLTAEDVLLVTGGGKGITAESALRIAQHSGCRLILMGRAPATDPAVVATLERAGRALIQHVYVRADVTDAEAVAEAIGEASAALGPVTGILHGAGTNQPVRVVALTRDQLDKTVAPKVYGLRNVLAAVDISRIRLLVGFGSIIGRAGLEGEAHYATANDWLTEEIMAFSATHPEVRARSIEWSVWSGAGMGEHLGVLESLQHRGIEPIPSEWGLDLVASLVDDPDLPSVVVVAGRTGAFATMRHVPGDVPLLRFLEKPQIHYAGVELVTEAELSPETDLYLSDHVLDGEMVFPAVMGMEAMAQAAVALRPSLRDGLAFTGLSFERPVIVPADATETIRIAALVEGDTVRVVIRTSATGFAVDHFSAVVGNAPDLLREEYTRSPQGGLMPLELDPSGELYGSLMFQGSRFQKVRNYRVALARRAVAELDTERRLAWFSRVHPQEMVLADPGARDAMMHAIQCCVPDAVLLPEGVDHLVPAMASYQGGAVVMEACEIAHAGAVYTYRLRCGDDAGTLERWEGLRLRAVKRLEGRSLRWSPTMIGPYLQRQSEEILGLGIEVAVEPHISDTGSGRPERREATARAIARLRPDVEVHRRGDGRLLLDDSTHGCSSHHDRFTLAVVGPRPVACDTEAVIQRTDRTWQGLLGEEWVLAREIAVATGCVIHEAATRVWGAMECVRKVGHASIGLSLASVQDDKVILNAGPYRVLTWVLPTGEDESITMFALLGDQ